jgi:hypothetical protein
MQVNRRDFEEYLETADFNDCGDPFEQKLGHYLAETFPNCERFWQVFVVPTTQRVLGYSSGRLLCGGIYPRKGIRAVLQDIAAAHYSVFFNLAFAHMHLEDRRLYSHEDIYLHLGSACELADRVLGMWHLTRLKCHGEKSEVFSPLDWDEVVAAAEGYREEYEDPTEYYLKHRRTQPIYLVPAEIHLVGEALGTLGYGGDYENIRNRIKAYRNAIVHDVRIGRCLTPEGKRLVPKLSKIHQYRTWRAVTKVVDNSDIVQRDFAEPFAQAAASIRKLEESLNEIWDKLIEDFLDEFYSDEGTALRELFKIKFSDKPKPVGSIPRYLIESADTPPGPSELTFSGSATVGPGSRSSASGQGPGSATATGGSAVWGQSSDDDY